MKFETKIISIKTVLTIESKYRIKINQIKIENLYFSYALAHSQNLRRFRKRIWREEIRRNSSIIPFIQAHQHTHSQLFFFFFYQWPQISNSGNRPIINYKTLYTYKPTYHIHWLTFITLLEKTRIDPQSSQSYLVSHINTK